MNNLEKVISKYEVNVRKIYKKNNLRIIDTDKGKLVLKRHDENESKLYEYLLNKNFIILRNCWIVIIMMFMNI